MNYLKAIELLDLSHNFSINQLKKSYKKKSLESHPDRRGGSHEKFIKINEAYIFLSDYHTNNKNNNENTQNNKINIIANIICIVSMLFNLFTKYNNNIKRVIILKSSLKDIINMNIYKLNINNNIYYIPLWCNKIYIEDEQILINIELVLKKNTKIINNDIYLNIKKEDLKYYVNDSILNKFNIIDNNIVINNIGITKTKPLYWYNYDFNLLFNQAKKRGNLHIIINH